LVGGKFVPYYTIITSTPTSKLLSNPIKLRQCEAIDICDNHQLNNVGRSILLKNRDLHFYKNIFTNTLVKYYVALLLELRVGIQILTMVTYSST